VGRHEEAITEMTAAAELDPLSSVVSHNLGQVYDVAGLEEKAIEQQLKTVDLNPYFVPSHEHLVLLYARRGMYTDAVRYAKRFLALRGRDPWSRSILAGVSALSGRREVARACLEELRRDVPSHAAGGLAFIYAQLGDFEETFACLEKSYQERDVYLTFLPILTEFRPLHSDPCFADLVRRIGLPLPRSSEIKRASLP
jgi:tetratricopeptide (TPR) repeat protein